jgi:hypothetical protein
MDKASMSFSIYNKKLPCKQAKQTKNTWQGHNKQKNSKLSETFRENKSLAGKMCKYSPPPRPVPGLLEKYVLPKFAGVIKFQGSGQQRQMIEVMLLRKHSSRFLRKITFLI